MGLGASAQMPGTCRTFGAYVAGLVGCWTNSHRQTDSHPCSSFNSPSLPSTEPPTPHPSTRAGLPPTYVLQLTLPCTSVFAACASPCPGDMNTFAYTCTTKGGTCCAKAPWHGCPSDYSVNLGFFCGRELHTIRRTVHGMPQPVPLQCADNEEQDAASCFHPCNPGFVGHLTMCVRT